MEDLHIPINNDDDVQFNALDDGRILLSVEDSRNYAQVFLSRNQAIKIRYWLGVFIKDNQP